MSLKDQSRSISKKLSNIARERNTAYLNVLTEFLIERLLVRIVSNKILHKSIVFKGGYVGLKVYFSPRYTVDLDAVLQKADVKNTLDNVRQGAEQNLGDGVWFRFEKEIDLKTQGEYGGIRVMFRAGVGDILKNIKTAQVINFDLGIGDPITQGPSQKVTPAMLGNDPIHWQVYPIETIIAEKIHALVDRGSDNSRSKDVFDLHLFLPKADSKKLKLSLDACFNHRKTALPKDLVEELKKIDLGLLIRGWSSATSAIAGAPTCEKAFQSLLTEINRLMIEE